jgi:hypothetical protein
MSSTTPLITEDTPATRKLVCQRIEHAYTQKAMIGLYCEPRSWREHLRYMLVMKTSVLAGDWESVQIARFNSQELFASMLTVWIARLQLCRTKEQRAKRKLLREQRQIKHEQRTGLDTPMPWPVGYGRVSADDALSGKREAA